MVVRSIFSARFRLGDFCASLLALFLWASIPVTAVWLLGLLLAIELICEGAALGHLAWQVRQS
jgi:uncharacterized membrane protein HdeD (DUF308 family)